MPCWALAIGLHHPVPRDLGPNPSKTSSCLTRVEFGTCTPPPCRGTSSPPTWKGKRENQFCLMIGTVEEIRPSPVEVGSLSYYLQGFIHPRWFSRRISEPSTVGGICDQQPRKANDPDEIFGQSLPPPPPPKMFHVILVTSPHPGGPGWALVDPKLGISFKNILVGGFNQPISKILYSQIGSNWIISPGRRWK